MSVPALSKQQTYIDSVQDTKITADQTAKIASLNALKAHVQGLAARIINVAVVQSATRTDEKDHSQRQVNLVTTLYNATGPSSDLQFRLKKLAAI